jgi:hypothetical protein
VVLLLNFWLLLKFPIVCRQDLSQAPRLFTAWPLAVGLLRRTPVPSVDDMFSQVFSKALVNKPPFDLTLAGAKLAKNS